MQNPIPEEVSGDIFASDSKKLLTLPRVSVPALVVSAWSDNGLSSRTSALEIDTSCEAASGSRWSENSLQKSSF